MTLTVDVICPWCFIGKRWLEKAVGVHDEPVTVQWHAFQLNPAMPKEGISRKEYRIRKFGSWERSMQLDANIVAAGKDEGILFDFDRMERTPNTVDAHRLIWVADKDGVQDAVVERLFRAYFTEGRDISNRQSLDFSPNDTIATRTLLAEGPLGQPSLFEPSAFRPNNEFILCQRSGGII